MATSNNFSGEVNRAFFSGSAQLTPDQLLEPSAQLSIVAEFLRLPSVSAAFEVARSDEGAWATVAENIATRAKVFDSYPVPGRSAVAALTGLRRALPEVHEHAVLDSIDDNVRRTREVVSNVVQEDGYFYVPAVVVGTGPAAQTAVAKMLESNPALRDGLLQIEAAPTLGGTFNGTNGMNFKLNSRTRPQELGVDGKPGTRANLNDLQPGLITLGDRVADTYATAQDLGEVVRDNQAISGNPLLTETSVVGWVADPKFESIASIGSADFSPGLPGQVTVIIEGPDNNRMTVRTDALTFTSGADSKPNLSSFDNESKEAVEANLALDVDDTAKSIFTYAEFYQRMNNTPFPLADKKKIAVLGSGDSGLTAVGTLLGYEKRTDASTSQTDYVEQLDWYGQRATDDIAFWERVRNGRYGSLGIEFPRRDNPNRYSRIRPINSRASTCSVDNDQGTCQIEGNEYDMVILATGASQTSENMVKELEIQPISLFDQSLDELIDATEDTGATIERGTVIAMPPQSKLREIMILDTYEDEYSSGLVDRYAVVKTASEDGSGIVEILLQSNDEYEDTLSAVLRQLRVDASAEFSKETADQSLSGIIKLPSMYRYLESIDADIENIPEIKKRLIRSGDGTPGSGPDFLQDAVAVREQLTDGPLLVTGIDGQIISLVLQPNDEVEVSKYAYNPESGLYDETYKDSASFGEATEFARMELEDELENGGVRTSCSGVFPIGYEALAFMRYGAQLVEKYGTEISVDDINDIGILADIQQDRSIIIPGTTSSSIAGPLFSNGIENQLMYVYQSGFGTGKIKTIFSPGNFTDSETFFTLTSPATLIKGADIRRALLSGELERSPEAGTRAYSSEELSRLTDAEFDAIVGSGNAIAVPLGADTSVRTGTPYPIDEGSSVVNGVAGRFITKTIDGIEVQRGGIRLTFDAFVRADDDSGTTLLSRQQLEDTASRVIVAPILFDRTVGYVSEQLPDNTTLGSIDNLEEIARRGGLIKYVLPNGEVEVVLPYVAEDGLTSYIRSSYRVLIDSTLKEAGRLDLSTVDYLNIAPITGEIIYPVTTASTRLRPPVNTRSESTFTSLELNGRQYPIAKKATKAPVFMSGVAADVKLDPKQTELVPNIPDNTQAIFANAPNARALGQVVATELAGIDGFLSSVAERDDPVGFNTMFMSLRMRDRLPDSGEAKYATALDAGVVAEYPGADSMTMFRYELLKNAKALGLRNTTISDTVQTAVRLEYAADSDEVVIAAKSSFGDETVLRKDVAVELFSPRALAWLKQATGRNTRSVNLELLFDERGLRIDAVSINSRQGKQKPRSGPDQADRIPLEIRNLAQ